MKTEEGTLTRPGSSKCQFGGSRYEILWEPLLHISHWFWIHSKQLQAKNIPWGRTFTRFTFVFVQGKCAFKCDITTFCTRVSRFFIVPLQPVLITSPFTHECAVTTVHSAGVIQSTVCDALLCPLVFQQVELFHSLPTLRTINFRVGGGGGREREADVSDNDENRRSSFLWLDEGTLTRPGSVVY